MEYKGMETYYNRRIIAYHGGKGWRFLIVDGYACISYVLSVNLYLISELGYPPIKKRGVLDYVLIKIGWRTEYGYIRFGTVCVGARCQWLVCHGTEGDKGGTEVVPLAVVCLSSDPRTGT